MVVVSRDAINQYSSVIVVAPLTTAANVKRSYPNNVSIAKSRLLRKRGVLTTTTIQQIDQALRITLDL